jgi:hypothetical protein
MRVITLSDMLGNNRYNLCILGDNKTGNDSVKDAIKSVIMSNYENCEGNYSVHIESAKYGDYVVVITTDQYVEPVAVRLALIQTVPVYGT